MIEYRAMRQSDITAGLRLCREARWNQLAREWEIFLKLNPDNCRVAVIEKKVVGTVTTMRYEDKFSWIGMLLVAPGNQRQGIGMQLLKEAIGLLKLEECIKLDATAAGRQVYLKLGFIDEYHLSRMQRAIVTNMPAVTTARPVREKDLLQLAAFDRNFFGADRQAILEWMWAGGRQFSFMVEQSNEVQGYCMGRYGYNYTHIGPLVAKDLQVAKELLTAVLKNCTEQPVILDAMHFDPEWLQWLNAIGFSEQRSFIRMYKGNNNHPGVPEKQFAILGPEFG